MNADIRLIKKFAKSKKNGIYQKLTSFTTFIALTNSVCKITAQLKNFQMELSY